MFKTVTIRLFISPKNLFISSGSIYEITCISCFRWAARFRQRLEDGDIKTVTEAKDAAVLLWKTHSGQYDDRRAVHVPSLDGRGHRVKRSRRSDETERDYRQRLKASRPERAPGKICIKR